MVLVDVDIIAGDDDGIAYFGGNSYGGTGYIKTDSALYKTETVVSIGTNQGREEYPNTITPTTILTTNTGGKAYFIFKGITIPQGSIIEDATFTFTGTGTIGVGAGAGQLFIEARKTASPTVPTGVGDSLFTKTVASNTATEALTNTTTATTINSDVKNIIQELVDTFDYNNDNIMLMIGAVKQVLPTGYPTSVQNENEIKAFELGGATIPNLTINYSTCPFNADFCEQFDTYALSKLPVPREQFTYSTKTIADQSWVSQDEPDNQVDVVNENFFFTVTRDGTNTSSTIDLGVGNVSDERWTLRCKITIGTPYTVTSSLSSAMSISLADTDSSADVGFLNNGVNMGLSNTIIGSGSEHQVSSTLNGVGTTSTVGANDAFTAGDIRYLELKRLSPTKFQTTIYTDNKYSVILDRLIITIPAEITGLRYIRLGSPHDNEPSYNGVYTGTVDNIEFWNEGHQGDQTFEDDFTQKAVTFEDDFTTDQWVDTGAGWGVNTGTEKLEATWQHDGADNHTSFDLGVISDENWVLRFKARVISLTKGTSTGVHFAITDTEAGGGLGIAQDSISGVIDLQNTVSEGYGIGNTTHDNALLPIQAKPSIQITVAMPIATDYFVELKRVSNTQATMQIFTDATYETPLAGVSSDVIPSTVDNLRFIKFFERESSFTDIITYEIDDLEFYNGTSTLTDWVPAGDNVIDTTNGNIIANAILDDSNHAISHDLQSSVGINADDKNWGMRFKLNLTTVTQGADATNVRLFMGISSLPSSSNSEASHDFLGFEINTGSVINDFRIFSVDGTALSSGTSTPFTKSPSVEVIFVSLSRDSETSFKVQLFSDVNYRDLIEEQTIATSSTVNTLRYIWIGNLDQAPAGADSVVETEIDNVEFYNCVSVPKTPIEEIKDFKDNFWEDNFTNMSGSKVGVNTTTQVIDWSSSVQAIYNEGEFIDILGKVVSTDRWVLRCKLNINTSVPGIDTTGNDMYIGLSADNTSLPNVAQDYVGWRWSHNNPSGVIRGTLTADNQIIESSPGGSGTIFTTSITTGTFYLTLVRSGTNLTATIYSDPDFTNIIEAHTEEIDVGIINLRYLKIMVGNFDGTGDSTFDGTIDDIEFWDGQFGKNHKNIWRETS